MARAENGCVIPLDVKTLLREISASPAAPRDADALAAYFRPDRISQQIGWLKMYAEGMTADNWADMKARMSVQLDMLSADVAALAQPATAGECQHCHDYVGKCPYCGRKRPAVGGERENPAQLAKDSLK